jgi:hypothetical protein
MRRCQVPIDAQQGATDEGECKHAGEVVERGGLDSWLIFRCAHALAGCRRTLNRYATSSSHASVVGSALCI